MKKLATPWLLLVLALIPRDAAAQDPLTLERAVADALAHNRSLGSLRAAADEAAAHMDEARSGFFPRLSVTEAWQRGDAPTFVFSSLLASRRFAASNFAIDALNHPDSIAFFHASVGVDQLVFDGGRQRSAARQASLQLAVARLTIDEATATLVVNTTSAFGRTIAADAARRAADAALTTAREDLARAERRRDAGMATDADVLALDVHVADLQHRVIQAAGDAAIARAELNRLTGADVDRSFAPVEPVETTRERAEPLDVRALMSEAEAARPELQQASRRVEMAEAARAGARGALAPYVSARAMLDVAGTRFAERASGWLVGGELQWTWPLGGADLARLRAARHAVDRAAAEIDDLRAAIRLDVITAAQRLETARARQAVGRATVEHARESQRIIRDRFDAGLAGVSDVLRASTSVLDAEAARIGALVDSLDAEALLRKAIGRIP